MTTARALDGIRVLDLSRVLAGPWSAQTLADLGAEVVKVEAPGGDDTRGWGPPFVKGSKDAAYFTTCNRNKRSVCIDFSTDEGADLVRRLIAESDIVVENFKLGGLKKYGLDHETMCAEHPGLIWCSITGFGQSGPYAPRPGYDFLIQGMGGLMSITGRPDDVPGGGPVKVGVAICDLFTGMYASVAMLAALRHRDATGEGQHIDCSLFDSQVAMLANQNQNWLVGGVEPGRMGNEHPNVVPYRAFAVADGHVILTVGNDRQFRRMCEAMDLDLHEDARFATNTARIENRAALDAVLEPAFAALTRDAVMETLEAAGVPCGPINTVPQVFADPHAQARGLSVPTTRPDGTDIPVVAFPARLSATPARYDIAPPTLGGDTQAVLREALGCPDDEIERLTAAGVIGAKRGGET